MARTLERLQQQYNSTAKAPGGRGPGGPGGRGPGGHGKPKNARATIARLLRYVARYKLRLIFVALCMLLQTVASLCGSYLLAPIIDRITLAVNPAAEIKMSAMEQNADRIIGALADTPFIASLLTGAAQKVTFYVLSGVLVLACVYLIGLAATYLQARLMMTVSQSAIESIRNDLFVKMQRLPVRYFDSNSTGEVMSRYTNDVDNIDTMLSNSLTSIFSGRQLLSGRYATHAFVFAPGRRPSMLTLPSYSVYSPARILSIVVLPLPFGPSRPYTPFVNSNDRQSTAAFFPNL